MSRTEQTELLLFGNGHVACKQKMLNVAFCLSSHCGSPVFQGLGSPSSSADESAKGDETSSPKWKDEIITRLISFKWFTSSVAPKSWELQNRKPEGVQSQTSTLLVLVFSGVFVDSETSCTVYSISNLTRPHWDCSLCNRWQEKPLWQELGLKLGRGVKLLARRLWQEGNWLKMTRLNLGKKNKTFERSCCCFQVKKKRCDKITNLYNIPGFPQSFKPHLLEML